MNRFITYSLIFFIASTLISCNSSEANLFSYEVCEEEAVTSIDHVNGEIIVTFPQNIRSAKDLCANFQLSNRADAYVSDELQVSGVSTNNYEAPFNFTIVSPDESLSTTWEVQSLNNDYTMTWGLGGFLQKELSHNRPYDWYIDQSQTGKYSDYNCAPSCVVMASHWQDPGFTYDVEDARSHYRSVGGGWRTQDIDNCLTYYNTEHLIISLSEYRDETLEILMNNLDDGNIILIPVDVHYLTNSFEPEIRINKYYETIKLGTGHCLVIKGYKQVDGKTYFEIYDPIGYDYKNPDGSYKGKDRYYSSDDIYTAAFASWNFAFVVFGPHSKKTSERSVSISDTPNILIL